MKRIILLISISIKSIAVFAQSLDGNKKWSDHFQLTGINQTHPSFKAKYSVDNSLSNAAESRKLSLTTTLFLGHKLWENGALYFNPEITGGSGISYKKGISQH